MKTVFDSATVKELNGRVAQLRPDSQRLWGKMTLPQALAHCSIGLEMARGEVRPPRIFIGRFIGRTIKRIALSDDEPMRRNSPSAPLLLVHDDRDFLTEHDRFSAALNRLASDGPQCCTTYPHAFFGPLTPDEWGILIYKHVDHHLRQFSA